MVDNTNKRRRRCANYPLKTHLHSMLCIISFASSSSLGIQYTFKALKITYCCMRGYLQKYLHKFHKVKSKV